MSTNKVCIIKCPAGIGDIFYAIKIATVYRDRGYEIVWPICKESMYLNDYVIGMAFYNASEDYPYKHIYKDLSYEMNEKDGIISLPLHKAYTLVGKPATFCMGSRYILTDIDIEDALDYFKFNRKLDKEYALFKQLGLTSGDKYAFVNRNYYPWAASVQMLDRTGTFPGAKDRVGQFRVLSSLPQINMSRIDGFTVFDWCLVLEQATEIWTMDTCVKMLIEELNMMPDVRLEMFARNGVEQVNYLCKKKKWRITDLKWAL